LGEKELCILKRFSACRSRLPTGLAGGRSNASPPSHGDTCQERSYLGEKRKSGGEVLQAQNRVAGGERCFENTVPIFWEV